MNKNPLFIIQLRGYFEDEPDIHTPVDFVDTIGPAPESEMTSWLRENGFSQKSIRTFTRGGGVKIMAQNELTHEEKRLIRNSQSVWAEIIALRPLTEISVEGK